MEYKKLIDMYQKGIITSSELHNKMLLEITKDNVVGILDAVPQEVKGSLYKASKMDIDEIPNLRVFCIQSVRLPCSALGREAYFKQKEKERKEEIARIQKSIEILKNCFGKSWAKKYCGFDIDCEI